MNNRITLVLDVGTGRFNDKKWSEVKVGDIVQAEKDKEFPADLVHVGAPKDIVYVDTMNLDGETNLKEKYVFAKNFTQ